MIVSLQRYAGILAIGSLALLLAGRDAGAAVTILEGGDPAEAPPATSAQPSPGHTAIAPPAAPPPPRLIPRAAPPAATIAPDQPPAAPSPSADILPNVARPNLQELATVKPANSAQLAVDILPGQRVAIGSQVSFRVSSKKSGYLVLLDVDATGHLSQIYPNTASLLRTNRANANLVEPNSTITIPLQTDPYSSIRYVVSPPTGQAMIVAVLSSAPVQILDLSDLPTELVGKPDLALAYLSKQTTDLRIPAANDQLKPATWSLDAKSYAIE